MRIDRNMTFISLICANQEEFTAINGQMCCEWTVELVSRQWKAKEQVEEP